MIKSAKISLLVFLVFLIPYLLFFHFSEPTQLGVQRNWISGELSADTPGWNITAPWVSVAKIDTRPMRVCITTAGRGFNCKLVRFVPEQYKIFVKTEGFYYYWWANRISFNLGYSEEYRGVRDIFRGYAFGAQPYPFFELLEEYSR